ncbi:MAG: hypothetical protein IH831_07325, partial [Planctomycetes bacterium]|nr:hypothetical protein [Planctomycetota bacterium]
MASTLTLTGFNQESFEVFLAARDEPGWLTDLRTAAWSRFCELAMPSNRDEEWMRTDIRLFKLDKYSLPTEVPEISPPQALLARRDLVDRMGYLNVRNTMLGLLDLRVVPIINENDVVAVEELVGELFGDNDTLSAMVANLVDADLLVLLGSVEGLYTADPHLDPSARLISTVERLSEE